MGGTIADKGGHNILEPALFGKPIIAGPHLENFRDIAEHFEKHNALIRIDVHQSSWPARSHAPLTTRRLGARALADR